MRLSRETVRQGTWTVRLPSDTSWRSKIIRYYQILQASTNIWKNFAFHACELIELDTSDAPWNRSGASAFCFPIKCSEQGQATGKWNNARCATSIGELVDGGQSLTALVITSKVNLSWLSCHNKVCKFIFGCPFGVGDINRCPRYRCMSLVYAEPCWAMLSLHGSWPAQGGPQNSLC